MKYKPITAVWEITMACNMRCKHCGSSCKEPLPDELSTEEAVKLARDIGDLGLKWITLSGGEPLVRRDWPIIAQELTDNGVIPNMITNGWLFNEEILKNAEKADIGTMAISLDGLKETHDYMRMNGSYDRIMNAFELMQDSNVTAGAITTIHNKNINELEEIKNILIDRGVKLWQMQIGLPMGNFVNHPEMIIKPEDVNKVIDFAHDSLNEDIIIFPADCIGYYNLKELEVRRKAYPDEYDVKWKGCTAGKRSFGVLHNGEILGCTSIRDREYIEGSIRETPLREIWENENNFSWSRSIDKSKLGGLCNECIYGQICLGGCPNTRLTMNGTIYSENNYCSYVVAMKGALKWLNDINEFDTLKNMAVNFTSAGDYQVAGMILDKSLSINPNDTELLSYQGFVSFMLGNYEKSKIANEKALSIAPDDAYINKGMGLSLSKLGKLDEGMNYLNKAMDLANENYLDPYYDTAVTLIEYGKYSDALQVIKKATDKYPQFEPTARSLKDMIRGIKQ
ncbi:radical SAM protein with 4Fe4S-binding SPASM domain [Methanococcus maripaludis]|uniref:Radical SAM protein with 4Fe4S-binding SPASM domain n=1 Tax=Methanococcus maripaludis TaxID=39152 RepID=A0A7J9P2F6_METMI|nr:radical SAM protein [Methanococcus maripaludis]MBA2853563.1 radical SAM protein with 4Fe4S-binding SPASM domain [Methanococcus maripaludis]